MRIWLLLAGTAMLGALTGCAAHEEAGLCTYFKACDETEDEDEDNPQEPSSAAKIRRSDPGAQSN